MSQNANQTDRASSPEGSGGTGPARVPVLSNNDDDRVIITKGEDLRLYHRSIWETLGESGWALFLVVGFLAMAFVGVVITLLK